MAVAAPGLVLATCNLHAGVGIDGHFDLQRIVAEIARLVADVVSLGAVDACQARSQGVHRGRQLGRRSDVAAFFGPSLGSDPPAAPPDDPPGNWPPQDGNAVLTRRRGLAVDSHMLARPTGRASEPRGCLEGVFSTRLATHWGLLAWGCDTAGLWDLHALRVSPEIERRRVLRLDAGTGAGPTIAVDATRALRKRRSCRLGGRGSRTRQRLMAERWESLVESYPDQVEHLP